MTTKKTKYIKNVGRYTIAPLIRNIVTIITLPIFTRYLSPKDYGILALITIIISLSGIFFTGLSSASYRFYYKYKDDINKLRLMLSTNLFSTLFLATLCSLILVVMFPFLNIFFFQNKLCITIFLVAFLQHLFVYINSINQNVLQIQHEGGKWFLNEVIGIMVQVVVSIFLVVAKIFTFEALIIAGVFAEAVKCLVTFVQLKNYYIVKFRYSFFKESLAYSWPNMPTSLIGFGYSYFDRILLSKLQGLSQVGILDMSNRLSSFVKMFMDGISGTLSPITLDLLKENTKESFKKIADLNVKVSFVIIFLGLAIILFTKEIVTLLTTKEYYFAIYVAPIYIYYYIFGVFGMISHWLIYYHTKKTFLLIPLSFVFFICSIIANVLLIPRFGVMGAAFAAFLATAVGQTFQLFIGLKLTPIPLDLFKLSSMFFLLFGETSILYVLYYLHLNIITEIITKLCMLLLFVLTCFLLKSFDFDDLKSVIIIFRDAIIRKKVTGQRALDFDGGTF